MTATVLVRVYLHDGGLRRIGELISVKDVSRGYPINAAVETASFTVADNDPLADSLAPQLGHAVVIESTAYPLSFVGKIRMVRATRTSGEIAVTCASVETILQHRILGDRLVLSQQAGDAVRDLLVAVNEANDTAIVAGSLEAATGSYTGRLYRMTAFDAIDAIARATGNEWWIGSEASSSGISLRLNMAPHRGEDRFGTTSLIDGGTGAGQGGNVSWIDYSIDGLSSTFRQGIAGGRFHAVEPPNATVRSDVDRGAVAPDAPHGYSVETGIDAPTALTRDEALAFEDALRDQDRVQEAAELMLGRSPAGVHRAVTVRVLNDFDVWADLLPGNIVRFVSSEVFFTGYNGPVRVRKVQPVEQIGELGVVLQLLRPKQPNALKNQV